MTEKPLARVELALKKRGYPALADMKTKCGARNAEALPRAEKGVEHEAPTVHVNRWPNRCSECAG